MTIGRTLVRPVGKAVKSASTAIPIFLSRHHALSSWRRGGQGMADQEKALLKKLRVEPGEKVRLKDRNPPGKSLFKDEDETKATTAALAKDIDVLQDRLYAEGARS